MRSIRASACIRTSDGAGKALSHVSAPFRRRPRRPSPESSAPSSSTVRPALEKRFPLSFPRRTLGSNFALTFWPFCSRARVRRRPARGHQRERRLRRRRRDRAQPRVLVRLPAPASRFALRVDVVAPVSARRHVRPSGVAYRGGSHGVVRGLGSRCMEGNGTSGISGAAAGRAAREATTAHSTRGIASRS